MADKALKLEIPQSTGCPRTLSVKDGRDIPVNVDDEKFSGRHVRLSNNAVVVKDFFGENNKVLDVSRYRIGEEGCCVHYDGRYRICDNRYIIRHCDVSGQALAEQLQQRPNICNIVLLLESPHKSEYEYIDGGIGPARAPASGPTGRSIDRCLGTILSRINCINAEHIVLNCEIIISNPIQFQASLHAIHGQSLRKGNGKWGKLRNNVWRALWSEQRDQFLTRLRGYNPKVVINACTGDMRCRKNQPKKFVEELIREHCPAVPLYNVYHPAYRLWNNCAVRPVPR